MVKARNLSPLKQLWLGLGILLCFLLHPVPATAQEHTALATGPEKGTLLLLGGGISEDQAQLFQKYAGGPEVPIVVIATAMSDQAIAKDTAFKKVQKRFAALNIHKVTVLHTRDRDVANSAQFIAPLLKTKGVFFLGGNTQNILDSYKNTRTEAAFLDVLNRGGIIAGASAGSGVQASFFYESKLVKGFEFLKNVVVMNHFLARNKQFDHLEEIAANRNYIALGIDDNAGILVQGERFEVVGNSYVAVYDQKYYNRAEDTIFDLPPESERFYILRNGDTYHLAKRQVMSNKRRIPKMLPKGALKEYEGRFKAVDKDFGLVFNLVEDTLYVQNSWGWDPYPVYPFEDDIFYATNRTMWFQFIRKEGKVSGVKKMKSILQDKVITQLEKYYEN